MYEKYIQTKEGSKAITMQPTLDKEVAIFQKAKFTTSSLAQANITNAIVKMLVIDIRPLHMVENEGFKDLISQCQGSSAVFCYSIYPM